MNDIKVKSRKRYPSKNVTMIEPKHKRRRSDKKSQSAKIISNVHRPLAAPAPMRITDLNDQCLEIIFKRLTARELLNVAAANKWLNASAGPVFRHTFGKKFIQLSSIAVRNGQIFVADQMILVSGLQVCLQFLRCFGSYISKLSLQFSDSSRKCINYVNQYVNEYCDESLIHITFHGATKFVEHYSRKPYKNVKSIYMTECRLVKQLPKFDCWFPNLQRLELVSNAFDPKLADVYFPHLRELRLFFITKYCFCSILFKYMTCLLRKNPHIKCLEIDIQLEQAAEELLTIENFLDSIKGNPAITKLQTTYGFGFNAINLPVLIELAHTLPMLIEIDLKPYHFSVDDAISFIRQHNRLKFFRFTIDKPSKFHDLKTQLDSEWQCSISVDKWQSIVVSLKR